MSADVGTRGDGVRSTLFVEGLALRARLGVYKRERGHRQPVSVDLEVGVDDLTRAAASERLDDTLNYEGIVRLARDVIARRHYPLVETLATILADELLRFPQVRWARVRLRKMGCMPDVDSAGTEVFLQQVSGTGGLRALGGSGDPAAPADSDDQNSDDQDSDDQDSDDQDSDDQDSDDADHPRPIHLSSLGQDEDAEGGVEDVIVVGGGVAGLAATRWCLRLGHAPLLIDPGPRLGGQLHLVHAEMTDLPALSPHAGLALARRLWRQLPTRTRWLETHLVRVSSDPQGLSLAVEAADGTRAVLRARTLILAMGLRRRYLGVPGERELAGCGILQTASKEIACVAGDRVVVVGGGDGACENALKLADAGAEPVLVHRGARLSARRALRDAVVSQEIPVRFETRVRRFLGDAGRLVAVELESGERVASPWALVRVGWVPQSASLPAAWRDDRGYVVCDAGLRVAGEARVFVAGDLRDPPAPSVASSCGDGASAAKAAIQRIEAMDDDDRA